MHACASLIGDSFVNIVSDHWRVIWMAAELFNAFVVAAITEELCKYYTFRAVEHPNLIFLTGLYQEKHSEENAVDGGLVKYPFALHQVQALSRGRSFESEVSEKSHRSSSSAHRNKKSSRKKGQRGENLIVTGTRDDEFDEHEHDIRTHRQHAMTIITGMIRVAVGLACAENFLYVFVLGGAGGEKSNNPDDHS